MPDKKIEDYLHLYLGCKMKVIKSSYPLVHRFSTHEGDIIDLDISTLDYLLNQNKIAIIKPILRPLSDMSEEETHEYRKIWLTVGSDGVFDYVDTPESFLWLLSKHFDLFNLIPKYAIDKTTLK